MANDGSYRRVLIQGRRASLLRKPYFRQLTEQGSDLPPHSEANQRTLHSQIVQSSIPLLPAMIPLTAMVSERQHVATPPGYSGQKQAP